MIDMRTCRDVSATSHIMEPSIVRCTCSCICAYFSFSLWQIGFLLSSSFRMMPGWKWTNCGPLGPVPDGSTKFQHSQTKLSIHGLACCFQVPTSRIMDWVLFLVLLLLLLLRSLCYEMVLLTELLLAVRCRSDRHEAGRQQSQVRVAGSMRKAQSEEGVPEGSARSVYE